MKKLLLLFTLSVFIPAVNAQTLYTLQGNGGVYSNSQIKFSNSPRINRMSATKKSDAEFMNAFFAGAGLASGGRLMLAASPEFAGSNSVMRTFLDPYIVSIDDNNYVLVKDNKDNNWTAENILGYYDSRDDLFKSLKQLESDGNASKITTNELKNADIRFVHLNNDGSLDLNNRDNDFDLKRVQYIDMKNLRTALGNKNQDGTFGYFYVIVKNGSTSKAYPGRVTFEDKEELNKYIK